jgi:hypothetical protein
VEGRSNLAVNGAWIDALFLPYILAGFDGAFRKNLGTPRLPEFQKANFGNFVGYIVNIAALGFDAVFLREPQQFRFIANLIVSIAFSAMEYVKNLTRVIRVGSGSCRNGSKVISAGYRVGIRSADAAFALCRYAAGSHGTVLATYTVFAELAVRRLGLYTVFVGFRAHCYRPLFELCGNFFHLFDGSHVF